MAGWGLCPCRVLNTAIDHFHFLHANPDDAAGDGSTVYPQTNKCERLYDLHDIGMVYLVRNYRSTGQFFARILEVLWGATNITIDRAPPARSATFKVPVCNSVSTKLRRRLLCPEQQSMHSAHQLWIDRSGTCRFCS